jgi:hypothetical protein
MSTTTQTPAPRAMANAARGAPAIIETAPLALIDRIEREKVDAEAKYHAATRAGNERARDFYRGQIWALTELIRHCR